MISSISQKMLQTVKQKYQESLEYLSEFLVKYMIAESVLERLTRVRLDLLVQEKKVVVNLSLEK